MTEIAAYRLIKRKYDNAFDGEGAWLYGRRWKLASVLLKTENTTVTILQDWKLDTDHYSGQAGFLELKASEI